MTAVIFDNKTLRANMYIFAIGSKYQLAILQLIKAN